MGNGRRPRTRYGSGENVIAGMFMRAGIYLVVVASGYAALLVCAFGFFYTGQW
jgi:hypothetical protein